jgi:hypothetical protein
VFPARYELNSYIVFRKRLVSKRLRRMVSFMLRAVTHWLGGHIEGGVGRNFVPANPPAPIKGKVVPVLN